jgi:hypothetical protein
VARGENAPLHLRRPRYGWYASSETETSTETTTSDPSKNGTENRTSTTRRRVDGGCDLVCQGTHSGRGIDGACGTAPSVRAVANDHPALGANQACPTRRIADPVAGSDERPIRSVAKRTVGPSPKPVRPALLTDHPRMHLKRWAVSDVLVVTARQLGDPVSSLVLVESAYHLLHVRVTSSTDSRGTHFLGSDLA